MSQNVVALGRIEANGLALLGTGFVVAENKIATAYHVVGPQNDQIALVMPRVRSLLDYQDTSDQNVNTVPLSRSAVDPIRDLCILEFDSTTRATFPYALGSADDVPPGSPVVTFGFPHANSGRLVLTQQIAHVGARILIENEGTKTKHIVLNTQAREGQSGGPVFASDLRTVVAVLLGSYVHAGGGQVLVGGIDPATLHQTTHAISAEYLRAMI